MKTTLLSVLASLFLLASCSKNSESKLFFLTPPLAGGESTYVIFNTQKSVGEELKLLIRAAEADQAGVWIDLNANGRRDENESVELFDKVQSYTLLNQSFVLYGKLTELRCPNNRIRSLDVSNSIYLKELFCSGNELSELNLDNNKALTRIDCSGNKLSFLNLKNNIHLFRLFCAGNRFVSLDLSANVDLEQLYCQNNKLTSLDLANNSKLTVLEIYGNQIVELYNMQAIVESLPRRSPTEKAVFTVLNAWGSAENSISIEQVVIAKEKNWRLLDSNQTECAAN